MPKNKQRRKTYTDLYAEEYYLKVIKPKRHGEPTQQVDTRKIKDQIAHEKYGPAHKHVIASEPVHQLEEVQIEDHLMIGYNPAAKQIEEWNKFLESRVVK